MKSHAKLTSQQATDLLNSAGAGTGLLMENPVAAVYDTNGL